MSEDYKKKKRPLPIIPPKIKPKIEDIETFEINKNISLPNDFKEFLINYNDCEFEEHLYDFSEIDSMLHFELDSLGIDIKLFELYSEKKEEYKEFEIDFPDLFESFLAFSYAEGGHAQICISVSGDNKGNVYYVYDEDIDMTFKITDSFTEFLNSSVSPYENEFQEACDTGNESLGIEVINNGLDLNTKNEYGSSLLDIAISSKSEMLNLVRLLIDKGLKKDDILYASMSKGHSKIFEYLLSKGYKIEQNKLEEFLIFSINKCYLNIFKLLFDIYIKSDINEDIKFYIEKSLIVLIEKYINQSTLSSITKLKYREMLEIIEN